MIAIATVTTEAAGTGIATGTGTGGTAATVLIGATTAIATARTATGKAAAMPTVLAGTRIRTAEIAIEPIITAKIEMTEIGKPIGAVIVTAEIRRAPTKTAGSVVIPIVPARMAAVGQPIEAELPIRTPDQIDRREVGLMQPKALLPAKAAQQDLVPDLSEVRAVPAARLMVTAGDREQTVPQVDHPVAGPWIAAVQAREAAPVAERGQAEAGHRHLRLCGTGRVRPVPASFMDRPKLWGCSHQPLSKSVPRRG
jgi:hypothetical protein